MFNTQGTTLFKPESMLTSSLADDKFMIIVVIGIAVFCMWSFKDKLTEMFNSIQEEQSSTSEPPKQNTMQSNPTPVEPVVTKQENIYVPPVAPQPQGPREISVRCPACGTVNKVREGDVVQCSSCLYVIQVMTR